MNDLIKIAENVEVKKVLDTKELNSPIPLLLAKKELYKLAKGEIIQVNCTDPGTRRDIQSWCQRLNHNYLGEKQHADHLSFFIKKT